jgi:uncharacterized membrane protein YqaE (UPF0057 family)
MRSYRTLDRRVLTILGYIPGIVHAVWVIAKY